MFFSHPGLTEDEILANTLTFFLAGYETTANTLTFLGYELATNAEAQDKLIAEIDEVIGNKVCGWCLSGVVFKK